MSGQGEEQQDGAPTPPRGRTGTEKQKEKEEPSESSSPPAEDGARTPVARSRSRTTPNNAPQTPERRRSRRRTPVAPSSSARSRSRTTPRTASSRSRSRGPPPPPLLPSRRPEKSPEQMLEQIFPRTFAMYRKMSNKPIVNNLIDSTSADADAGSSDSSAVLDSSASPLRSRRSPRTLDRKSPGMLNRKTFVTSRGSPMRIKEEEVGEEIMNGSSTRSRWSPGRAATESSDMSGMGAGSVSSSSAMWDEGDSHTHLTVPSSFDGDKADDEDINDEDEDDEDDEDDDDGGDYSSTAHEARLDKLNEFVLQQIKEVQKGLDYVYHSSDSSSGEDSPNNATTKLDEMNKLTSEAMEKMVLQIEEHNATSLNNILGCLVEEAASQEVAANTKFKEWQASAEQKMQDEFDAKLAAETQNLRQSWEEQQSMRHIQNSRQTNSDTGTATGIWEDLLGKRDVSSLQDSPHSPQETRVPSKTGDAKDTKRPADQVLKQNEPASRLVIDTASANGNGGNAIPDTITAVVVESAPAVGIDTPDANTPVLVKSAAALGIATPDATTPTVVESVPAVGNAIPDAATSAVVDAAPVVGRDGNAAPKTPAQPKSPLSKAGDLIQEIVTRLSDERDELFDWASNRERVKEERKAATASSKRPRNLHEGEPKTPPNQSDHPMTASTTGPASPVGSNFVEGVVLDDPFTDDITANPAGGSGAPTHRRRSRQEEGGTLSRGPDGDHQTPGRETESGPAGATQDQEEEEHPRDDQPGAGQDAEAPDERPAQNPAPVDRHDDPVGQVVAFLWDVVRFFTFQQPRNLWALGSFVLLSMLYYVRRLWNVILVLAGQGARVIRRQPPILPMDQILSLAGWTMLMWFLTMTIALNEERRLWQAANPRTASYFRGTLYRQPYPWWSPFAVDYALLELAWHELSRWAHRVCIRPGLDHYLRPLLNRTLGTFK